MKTQHSISARIVTTGAAAFFSTSLFAATVAPQPINDINPKGGSDPQIIGHVGNYMLFTASPDGKRRYLYSKSVTYFDRSGIEHSIPASDIATTKYPVKLRGLFTGEADQYVAEYDVTNYSRAVAFFHQKGKGLWRASSQPTLTTALIKTTDTDPTGADPDKMMSGLTILDDVGQYPNPSSKTNLYPIALFAAPDRKVGKELWVSNGSAAGTKVLKDINATVTGTGRTAVPNGSSILPISSYYPDLAESYGGKAYFSAFDGTGFNLFEVISHPTATRLQPRVTVEPIFSKTLYPNGLAVQPTNVVATPDGVIFTLPTLTSNGPEIWGYDPGHPENGPIVIGGTNGNPGNLTPDNFQFHSRMMFGDNLGAAFAGDDGAVGREPYIASIGVNGGIITPLGNINLGGSSSPRNFTQGDNTIFFVANPGTGEHLYRTNGTQGGLDDLGAFNNIRDITPVVERFSNGDGAGDNVYFVADDNTGTPVLWNTYTFEGQGSNSAIPTQVLTTGGFPIKNPTNLAKLVTNGIYSLFFVTDGVGTEYENIVVKNRDGSVKSTTPRGKEVWYLGDFLN